MGDEEKKGGGSRYRLSFSSIGLRRDRTSQSAAQLELASGAAADTPPPAPPEISLRSTFRRDPGSRGSTPRGGADASDAGLFDAQMLRIFGPKLERLAAPPSSPLPSSRSETSLADVDVLAHRGPPEAAAAKPPMTRSKSGRFKKMVRKLATGDESSRSPDPSDSAALLFSPPTSPRPSEPHSGSGSGGSVRVHTADPVATVQLAVCQSMRTLFGESAPETYRRLSDALGNWAADVPEGGIHAALAALYEPRVVEQLERLIFSPLVTVPLDTAAAATAASPPAPLGMPSAVSASMPTLILPRSSSSAVAGSGPGLRRPSSSPEATSPRGGDVVSAAPEDESEKMRLAREKLMGLLSKAPSRTEKSSSLAGIYTTDDGEFVRRREVRLPIDIEYIQTEAAYEAHERELAARSTPERPVFLFDAAFRLELGTTVPASMFDECCRSGLLPLDVDQLYYRQFFHKRDQMNFAAEYSSASAAAGEAAGAGAAASLQSYALVTVEVPAKGKASGMRKVLLRHAHSIDRSLMPMTPKMTAKATQEALRQQYPLLRDARLMEVREDDGFAAELLNFEAKLGMRDYKFGVLYAAAGQTHEAEMFGNRDGSSSFDAFLALLGERIVLQGWSKFRGGLDVNNHSTGEYSVFATHGDLSIMFHVSTLLPYVDGDEQQLERKRHLGNDLVVLVFQEGDAPLPPFLVLCEFIHTYVVVRLCPGAGPNGGAGYRVAVCDRLDVRPYGPIVPRDHVFAHGQELREFVMTKMLNAERSAIFSAAAFVNKMVRTRDLMLRAIAQPLFSMGVNKK